MRSLAANDVCPFERNTQISTGRLLARLKEHHDYAIRMPVCVAAPEPEPLRPIPNEALRMALAMVDRPENGETWHGKVETIQRAVTAHFPGITVTDLKSHRRTANVVAPRQIAMYLAKTLTLRSLPDIGRRFGGRDHTTVLHAVRKITGLIERDPLIAGRIEQIKLTLEVTL